ncbi:uncharacterized protein CC84DRAFT_938835 [Paraphaeosphaeria sporulosa]|uniref:Uncharacterized protein n=1 Tax=Paraphaeosphaeria sporulosa TaxID=1460663 RepID=A0A177C7Y9_9PLEO|nr:uncharacterized protein CC84DRAFT_938835 [Paraphaeosphaeria sporulosa]OAG02969.1 hypothetical protein CC84DRAFT_938835 [Paraphaeosphaeria sporulosa]
MDGQETRRFLSQYSSTIGSYRQRLKEDLKYFKHTQMKLPPKTSSRPDFLVVPGPGEPSWLNILGGVDLVGVRSTESYDRGATKIQIRAKNPLVPHASRNGRRRNGESDRHMAHSLIVRQLAAMKGMNHARFLNILHWGRNRFTPLRIMKGGDIHGVSPPKYYFRNEFSSANECSIDNDTGDQTKSLSNCHEFLDDDVDPVLRKIGLLYSGNG